MSRRPYVMAFGFVLMVALLVLNLPQRQATRAKLAWGSVFMPVFGLAGSVEGVVERGHQALLPRSYLARQIETLRQENQALRLEILQAQSVRQENDRLRAAVAWQQQTPWRLRLGRVIGQDPSNWWRTMWIDLGEREEIQVNMPVLTSEGLVGRVAEVAFARSRVVLVGDPQCRFAAQVGETRDKGIVAPDEASFDRQVVHFTYVPTTVTLAPGALVLTSGDGGVFPKGIPVGRIVDVATNRYGLFLEARLRLSANLNRLEEVWVIVP
jgi:rod shape-determining protein MreC